VGSFGHPRQHVLPFQNNIKTVIHIYIYEKLSYNNMYIRYQCSWKRWDFSKITAFHPNGQAADDQPYTFNLHYTTVFRENGGKESKEKKRKEKKIIYRL